MGGRGAPKGGNRFLSYQNKTQARRIELMTAFLTVSQKSRAKYDYVTDLAKAAAIYISDREKRNDSSKPGCNPATLLRNPKYKALLIGYLADNLSAKGKSLKVRQLEAPQAKASVLLQEIEASNLKRENIRLKAHVEELKKKLDAMPSLAYTAQSGDKAASENAAHIAKNNDLEYKYITTCQALRLLLNRESLGLVADTENMWILDGSLRRNNVIVSERHASPFFEWFKGVQGIKGSL